MSSFTTGDSGYGKSLEKENHNYPSNSVTGSCSQTWKNNSDDCVNKSRENFSACLALTEESLSAHNRINHKHLKQHQRKAKTAILHSSTLVKENNWFPTKEIGHNKHKKCSHSYNMTVSTPTQTDLNFTNSHNLHLRYPSVQVASAASPSHMPQPQMSCFMPPNNFSSATPAPFFIPGN